MDFRTQTQFSYEFLLASHCSFFNSKISKTSFEDDWFDYKVPSSHIWNICLNQQAFFKNNEIYYLHIYNKLLLWLILLGSLGPLLELTVSSADLTDLPAPKCWLFYQCHSPEAYSSVTAQLKAFSNVKVSLSNYLRLIYINEDILYINKFLIIPFLSCARVIPLKSQYLARYSKVYQMSVINWIGYCFSVLSWWCTKILFNFFAYIVALAST